MKLKRGVSALIPGLVAACAGLAAPAVQAQAPDYSKVEFAAKSSPTTCSCCSVPAATSPCSPAPMGDRDVLVAIRQRVSDLIRKGRSLEQISAAAPSREFDERWGKGLFSPDAFVQRVYIELNRKPGAR